MRPHRISRLSTFVSLELLVVLVAIFVFSLGSGAWSSVVAGRLTQDGASTSLLGILYAVCELVRLPAALLLPTVTLRHGARRVTQVGLILLLLLPLIALTGLDTPQLMLIFVLTALPAMAVYVGLPALVIGASDPGRDGMSLAWLGLAGGAGGALGPWVGGTLTDSFGVLPVLLVFAASSALLLPVATFGALPPRTAWQGWAVLAGRGLPWKALAALGLASAADAGRAALVPSELVRTGQPLGDAGLLLTVGCAVAGFGFLAFGRLADKRSVNTVVSAGVAVLVCGSFLSALSTGWAPGFVVATAVLGMGASGTRLGAELALIGWVGRDRAAVAAALGETTILGGRALGAPAAGSFGTAYGGASAFWAIGLCSLLASAVLMLLAVITFRRAPALPVVPAVAVEPPAL
ncbi:MAG TPA: MFS transporter [Chloroflexota bacterium]|jgi:MFS family permease